MLAVLTFEFTLKTFFKYVSFRSIKFSQLRVYYTCTYIESNLYFFCVYNIAVIIN